MAFSVFSHNRFTAFYGLNRERLSIPSESRKFGRDAFQN